ncbi:hypothetical protein [Brevibacillus sp. HB1.4B]|nr:hypothetical protein [Brevibacillus sp. HB1.4B]
MKRMKQNCSSRLAVENGMINEQFPPFAANVDIDGKGSRYA